jgi:hypothetical protein
MGAVYAGRGGRTTARRGAEEKVQGEAGVVGMLTAATGWLPPVAAAAAQSLPDVAVMLNASRLLRVRSVRMRLNEGH